MKIDGGLITNSLQLDNKNLLTEKEITNGNAFESFFNAALNLYDETNKYQIKADQIQRDFVTGKTDDMIALNMAQRRAADTIQFTTQVTNKILTAYQEIMRIQL